MGEKKQKNLGLAGSDSAERILGTWLTFQIVQKGSDPLVWLQDWLPHAHMMALYFLVQDLQLIS